MKAFHRAQAIKPGFNTETLALLSFDLNLAGYDRPRAKQALRSIAVISARMAREFWPGQEALGKRFRFFQGEPLEVVGIVQDVKLYSLGEDPSWIVYLPMHTQPQGGVTLVVNTVGAPGAVLVEAQRIIRQLDSHIPITYAKTMPEHLAIALWPSWMGAVLLGAFGLLALVLASMGVYGVMAYSVNQRTRELGIRMALGAQAHQVLALVLRQGMTLAAIGLVIGLVVAFGSTRLIAALLYGVDPSDPWVFAGVTIMLALAALAACYLPARRALKIDPVVALRFE